jgi:DNA-binding transcriptional MerR regulator
MALHTGEAPHMPEQTTWTLDELAALVDLPRRTLRYYIQIGLVDRPDGETRAARYGERHLAQLTRIRRWQDAGLSLERIRELLAGDEDASIPARPRRPGTVEVWSHLLVADGIELQIEPGRAGLTPEQVRALAAAVMNAYTDITQGTGKDDTP